MWLAPAATPSPVDDPPPSVSYTIDGINGTNGWYRGSTGGNYVVVHWTINDPTLSSTSGCEPAVRVDGPNTGTTRTCTATGAGGTTTVTTKSIKIDANPPVFAPSPDRGPNANGWYRSPVSVSWHGTDATSGIASCPASSTYSGPDSASAAPSMTCTDQAGNPATVSFPLKYDSTAPVASSAAPARNPDANGWFNHQVTINWSGSDATSGPVTCTSLAYNGPDGASIAPSGTCIDQAGNTSAPLTLPNPIKYDSIAPTPVQAVPARGADQNGWYNKPVAITWSGSDVTSGIAGCSSLTYSGPDSASAAPSGSCSDQAGNSASVAFPLKYDKTAPVANSAAPARAPDANGWYNHLVPINWSGSDATSGPVTCTSLAYNGPDGASIAPSGTCIDQAGNTSAPLTLAAAIQFDATPPTALQAVPARGPDHNGWYNKAVAITWSGSDGISGIAACSSLTYSSPDSASAAPSGSCTDQAGNTASATFPLQFDATAPAVVASPTRVPDANGWYNHGVTVGWAGSDPASGIENCTDAATYAGPDSAGVAFAGACTDKAGNSSSNSFQLRYDATAPAVSAQAERAPDHNGWYNRPVRVDFAGTDALSGVDSCTSLTYSGPFIKSIAPVGSCRDRAGNNGFASVPINYDSTPPTLSGFAVESEERADVVRWKSSSPDDVATVSRAARGGRRITVFNGSGTAFADKGIRAGLEYRYSVQTLDQAGNNSRRLSGVALPKVVTLRHRGYVPRTSGAPVLRLPAVAGATYYHVQLFRRGARILAAWPLRPELGLRTSWRWAGRTHRLTRGRYRWFAWAGFGRRSAARYKRLGSAEFVVARS
jgi:hypothetical protein